MAQKKMTALRLPWMTLIIAGLASLVYCLPQLSSALIYDRDLVFDGQWWRVATSLLVHYSVSHLVWNLLVLVVFGTLIEASRRAAFVWLILLCMAGNSLLVLNSGIALFAGISGLVVALAAYCCMMNIARAEAVKPWSLLLITLLAKVGYEAMSGTPLFAGGDFRVLPQVHLAGLIAALILLVFFGTSHHPVVGEEQGYE